MKIPPKLGLGFYTHPSDLVPEQIDPLIRDIVFRINESGWVWTAESCQGHPDATDVAWADNTDPMLRLITERKYFGTMMDALLSRSIQKYEWGGEVYGQFRVYPHKMTEEWAEILVYIYAKTVYGRDMALRLYREFAETINLQKPE